MNYIIKVQDKLQKGKIKKAILKEIKIIAIKVKSQMIENRIKRALVLI